ncbi:hypothetical protein C8R46DRAFT_1060130 [Mycena filopes]|nr:hypothetical protein C8R46DRAFT_1060130 [Mycena filopes]
MAEPSSYTSHPTPDHPGKLHICSPCFIFSLFRISSAHQSHPRISFHVLCSHLAIAHRVSWGEFETMLATDFLSLRMVLRNCEQRTRKRTDGRSTSAARRPSWLVSDLIRPFSIGVHYLAERSPIHRRGKFHHDIALSPARFSSRFPSQSKQFHGCSGTSPARTFLAFPGNQGLRRAKARAQPKSPTPLRPDFHRLQGNQLDRMHSESILNGHCNPVRPGVAGCIPLGSTGEP